MANPQKENGYTPIANELLEAIYKSNFNGTQMSIIFFIIRFTYGFNRVKHEISLSFMHNVLGGNIRSMRRELQKLIDGHVINICSEASFASTRELSVNKDYEQWSKSFYHLSKKTTVGELAHTGQKDTFTEGETAHTTVGELAHQERNIKENIKKDEHILFFDTVWQLYPYKKGKPAVSAKAKKELHKVGYDLIAASIENYTAQKPEWQEYMYGSTFFNGRWREYAESEPQEHTESINNDGWNY